jgi:endonuclease/exonuclease/phosphatase (EEP) superfamily protein YafD
VRLLRLGVATLALFSVAGALLQQQLVVAEWMAHFRLQYLLLALVAATGLAALRSWRWAALGTAVVALNAAYVLPWYLGSPLEAPAKGATLKLLVANVHTSNRDHRALLELVERDPPDVLLLQEIDARWERALAPLRRRYPHGRLIPRPDNFGIGLLSRLPLTTVRELTLGGTGRPSLEATVVLATGRAVRVVCTHPYPPVDRRGRDERDAQLRDAARHIGAQTGPRVLAGDFNATMFGSIYREALARSQLGDARQGRGLLPTWPVNSGLLTLLRVPLDHLWYSRELRVRRFEVGPDIGSDHLPLRVELVLRER